MCIVWKCISPLNNLGNVFKTTLFYLTFIVITACNGASIQTTFKPKQPITFQQDGIIELKLNQSLTNPIISGNVSEDIIYQSSDPTIATIDENAHIQPIATGEVIISASTLETNIYDATSVSFTLKIVKSDQTIEFNQAGPLIIHPGDSIDNTVSDGLGTGEISYHSSDNTIARVDDQGKVTSFTDGSVTISAIKAADNRYDRAITTYILDIIKIEQNIRFQQSETINAVPGDTFSNPIVNDLGSGKISYQSSNTNIATVDQNGTVTLHGQGNVTINAVKSSDARYQSSENHYDIISKKLTQNIYFKNTGRINASPGDVIENPIFGELGDGLLNYQSSDPKIATINDSGQVTLLDQGIVVISVIKYEDMRYLSSFSQYEIQSDKIEQSLSFSQQGPIEAISGDIINNPIINGLGSGLLTYQSSDINIATVDSNGKVSLLDQGSVIISALKSEDLRYRSATQQYKIHSTKLDQTISFTQTVLVDLLPGDIFYNPIIGQQGTGAINYQSSDSNVATINNNGQVTVIKPGVVTISAQISEDIRYLSTSTNYQLTVNKIEQEITFSKPHSHQLFIDDNYYNPINTPHGTGTISYQSSDEAIASVDVSGNLVAHRYGHVVITATIAPDDIYSSANTSYIIDVVPNGVLPAHALIGVNNTELNFPQDPTGLSLHTTNDPDCDIENFFSCQSSQLLELSNNPITDNSLTLNQDSYYSITVGNSNGGLNLASANYTKFSGRRSHEVVVFNNKILLIGGIEGSTFLSDIWTSYDGINWIKITDNAPFGQRAHTKLKIYQNKLWLIGGISNNDTYMNDIWSAVDGINWKEERTSADFSGRYGHQLVIFQNKLWLIGGRSNDGYQNDVWSSDNGTTWTLQTANADFSPRHHHQVLSYQGKMWLLAGYDGSSTNDIWSSTDGITWILVTAAANFPVRYSHQAIIYNNKMYLIGGYYTHNDIWTSDDGISWQLETNNTQFSGRFSHKVITFQEKLWLIGGNDKLDQNDIWLSSDGVNWSEPIFYKRHAHEMVTFNNNIWLFGGFDCCNGHGVLNDIWFSDDGIYWDQVTANSAFSPRFSHQVIIFQHKHWVIGGDDGSPNSSGAKNDIWSSVDGITWNNEISNANFSPRWGHQVLIFNNRLWLIAGSDGNHKSDVWVSDDAITWSLATADAGFPGRNYHEAVVFQNKIWVIGGFDGQGMNDIWSSVDGINWVEESPSAAFSKRYQHQVVHHDDKLWMTAGRGTSSHNDLWSSSDGINWIKEVTTTTFSKRRHHQALIFKDKIWVVGGYDGAEKNDIWSLEKVENDALDWRRHQPLMLEYRVR